MSPAPIVSFVVPVKNDAKRLERCLESIRAADSATGAVEIIVADNGSVDRSVEVARDAGAIVLELPGVRLGELRNRGAAAASGDILAFVDADHEIARQWVSAAIEALRRADVAAVGAPYDPPTPATWVQRLYDRLRRHSEGQTRVAWLGSGNMAVRRLAFESVGGFDTTLETCEDVDLCRKLTAAGHGILADSRLRNIHYGDPRTLGHVFYGELWRGRDNVRVSLRAPRDWRTLLSAAIPAVVLVSLATSVVGLVTGTRTGLGLAALATFGLIGLLTTRAALMARGLLSRDLPGAFAVAAAYEFGRAFALTARVTHARRRAGATA